MKLIEQVFDLCKNKLVGQGWDVLLKQGHGLDIDQPTPMKLEQDMARAINEWV